MNKSDTINKLARMAAIPRLHELGEEISGIMNAFPDLQGLAREIGKVFTVKAAKAVAKRGPYKKKDDDAPVTKKGLKKKTRKPSSMKGKKYKKGTHWTQRPGGRERMAAIQKLSHKNRKKDKD